MSHDVFISYSRGDRELAALLARKLEESGVSAWYDAGIAARPSSGEDVPAALGDAGLVAVLFSDECNRSVHMRTELAAADALGKPVVPLLIENAQPAGALLHRLADRNWIQAYPEPMARIDELADLLARLAGKAPPVAAPGPTPPPLTLEEKERSLDRAIGEMIRDVVDPAHAPPSTASAYVGLTDGHGNPVRRLSGNARAALTVATLGAYGVLAQRRAIGNFRANIRKL